MAYGLKDSCNTIIYHRNTNKPFLFANYLNTATLTIEGESVFARAKGVSKIGFEGAKTGTFKMETEMFEFKYLALLLGGKVSKGTSKIAKRFNAKVGADKTITVPGTPLEASISVFKVERDNKTHVSEVISAFTKTADGANTKMVWTDGIAEGDNIAIYYLVNADNVSKITVSDAMNNDSFRIYGITSMKDEFGEEKLFQFDLLNAKTQVNAELTLDSGAVTTFSATFDLMLDENNELLELTLLNDDAVTGAQVKSIEEKFVSKSK